MVRCSSLLLPVTLLLACAGPQASTKTTEATAPQSTAPAVSEPAPAAPLAAAPARPAAKLTVPERENAMKDLEESRHKFLASLKGLSEAQFRFKPAPDRWSVAEVAEHITLTEARIFGMITEKLMRTATAPELLAQVPTDDDKLRRAVTDRSAKVKAPEMLHPTGRWNSVDAVSAAFDEGRGKAVAYVRSTQEDLRGHAAEHPLFKALDGYQWILLMAAHSARHTAQIEEVKADPRFPRK